MANNFIQLPADSVGKKLQTWDNTIAGNDVHAEGMVVVDSTGTEKATAANPVRVDPTGTTAQPIKLQDGSGNAITSDTRGSERPLSVQILDASGNQITSFGGSGGNAAAGPTGSAVPTSADYTGFNSGGNLVGVSSANPLPVAQQGTATVSGTVTANAGSGTFAENLTQVAGTSLGATAIVNYGSTPAAVAVPAVNAFITNTPAVTLSSTTITNTVAENLTQVAGVNLGSTAVTNFGTAPAAAAVPGVNASIYAGTTGITATGSSLNVDVTNTVPVSGTVTANQGGAPWTVKPDGTAWTLTGTSANVDVTNTVPVSQSGTWNVGLQAGTNTIGAISNTGFNVNNFPAVQLVANNPGDSLVSALADTDGNLVGVTDNALDVNLKYPSALGIADSTGNSLASTNAALNTYIAGANLAQPVPVALSTAIWGLGITSAGFLIVSPLPTAVLAPAQYLIDSLGNGWQLSASANGITSLTKALYYSAPSTIFLSDPSGATSWQISANTNGQLVATAVSTAVYPISIPISTGNFLNVNAAITNTPSVSVTNTPSVVVTSLPSVTVANPSANFSLESGGNLAGINQLLQQNQGIAALLARIVSLLETELVVTQTAFGIDIPTDNANMDFVQ